MCLDVTLITSAMTRGDLRLASQIRPVRVSLMLWGNMSVLCCGGSAEAGSPLRSGGRWEYVTSALSVPILCVMLLWWRPVSWIVAQWEWAVCILSNLKFGQALAHRICVRALRTTIVPERLMGQTQKARSGSTGCPVTR